MRPTPPPPLPTPRAPGIPTAPEEVDAQQLKSLLEQIAASVSTSLPSDPPPLSACTKTNNTNPSSRDKSTILLLVAAGHRLVPQHAVVLCLRPRHGY